MSEKLFYEFSGDGTSFLLPDVASTKRDGIVHSFAVMQYEKGGFMKLPKYLANLYFVVEVEETGRGVCYEFFSGCCIGPWKDGECRAKSNELSVNLRAGSNLKLCSATVFMEEIRPHLPYREQISARIVALLEKRKADVKTERARMKAEREAREKAERDAERYLDSVFDSKKRK